jgi:hypothetical protein
MTSIALSPYTMAAALLAADSFLGRQRWEGDLQNKIQMDWLERYTKRATEATTIDEISSHSTTVFDAHSVWLKTHGWDSDISPGQPGDLYLAAVLAIGGKWMTPGKEYEDKDGIARAVLKNVFASRDQSVTIETQVPGVYFHIKQPTESIVDEKTLLGFGTALVQRAPHTRGVGAKIDFPMIDLNLKSGAEYMLGIYGQQGQNSGVPIINQAAEGFILKMNHLGGLAKAKAELGMTRGFDSTPTVVIDGPFVVAVEKQGVSEPVFVAYCDRDSWKNPGSF